MKKIWKVWKIAKVVFLFVIMIFGFFWPDGFMALRKIFATGALLMLGEMYYEYYVLKSTTGKEEESEDSADLEGEEYTEIFIPSKSKPVEPALDASASGATVDELESKLKALRAEGRSLVEKIMTLDPNSSEAKALDERINGIRKNISEVNKLLNDAKRKAEEEAKQKAEEEARRKAEEEARRKAEEEARRKAEEEAKRKAEEEARRKAEEEARRKAEEEAFKKRIEAYLTDFKE